MYQQMTIVGRTTKDLVLEQVGREGNKFSKAKGSIAYKSKEKGEDGKPKTKFKDFEITGSRAENLAKYAGKGSIILLVGEDMEQTWLDATTQEKRSRSFLSVSESKFIETKTPGAAAGQTGTQQNQGFVQQNQAFNPQGQQSQQGGFPPATGQPAYVNQGQQGNFGQAGFSPQQGGFGGFPQGSAPAFPFADGSSLDISDDDLPF